MSDEGRHTNLVSDITARAVVRLVGVLNQPRSGLVGVVIGDGALGRLEDLLLGREAVSVEVLRAADIFIVDDNVHLDYRILQSVDHGINAV